MKKKDPWVVVKMKKIQKNRLSIIKLFIFRRKLFFFTKLQSHKNLFFVYLPFIV